MKRKNEEVYKKILFVPSFCEASTIASEKERKGLFLTGHSRIVNVATLNAEPTAQI
ncbi:hypothetical protein JXB27_00545 [Candidatus Woesearchaeota archaeon]|nr:hypothetical protein [Candidatus Woesearchaeota archaeon]